MLWKTQGVDGTSAAVEVVGIDPSNLPALKSPAMTLERWTSFLTVRVAREGPDEHEQRLLPSGARTASRQMFSDSNPASRWSRGFAIEPSSTNLKFQAVVRALSRSQGKQPTPSRFPRPNWLPNSRFPRGSNVRPRRLRPFIPRATILPENLLRFYIHFSAPMSRGEAYHRIKLLDATGKPVADPFLELGEELWSNDGTRFTLLFDPGRIKRGLKPREEVGPVLEAGKSYCLVIDRDWPDATGKSAPDRVSQVVSGWTAGRFVA